MYSTEWSWIIRHDIDLVLYFFTFDQQPGSINDLLHDCNVYLMPFILVFIILVATDNFST